MPHQTPDQIADIVLGKRPVYGLDVDCRIRGLANRLTARAFFEALANLDDASPNFASNLSEIIGSELSGVIGFHTGAMGQRHPPDFEEQQAEAKEYYLKIVFCDEQAAYYQFHLFPDLSADYVLGAAQKRAGAIQHLRITLSSPEALQTFIESCRSNPHFARVEESSAEEFEGAPSHGV
jgi:hypothetical protein